MRHWAQAWFSAAAPWNVVHIHTLLNVSTSSPLPSDHCTQPQHALCTFITSLACLLHPPPHPPVPARCPHQQASTNALQMGQVQSSQLRVVLNGHTPFNLLKALAHVILCMSVSVSARVFWWSIPDTITAWSRLPPNSNLSCCSTSCSSPHPPTLPPAFKPTANHLQALQGCQRIVAHKPQLGPDLAQTWAWAKSLGGHSTGSRACLLQPAQGREASGQIRDSGSTVGSHISGWSSSTCGHVPCSMLTTCRHWSLQASGFRLPPLHLHILEPRPSCQVQGPNPPLPTLT